MKNTRSLLAALAACLLVILPASANADAIARAAAALKAGDLAAAETQLAPLTGADATEAAAFHLLSQVRVQQRRAKEAVELAERATALDATQADHFSQLGVALSLRMGELGLMQQAMLAGRTRAAFEKSVELDPRHVAGLIGLARYYAGAPEIAGGSMVKAREFATRVREIVPHLGEAELGRLAEREEDWTGALAHYESVLTARPESAAAQVAAGRMLARLGRSDEARTRYETALKLHRDFAPALQALEALTVSSSAR